MSFLKTQTAKEIVKEGAFDALKIGAAETYFGAFGVFLGGSPLQIGALATLPPLIGAMFQAYGMRLAELVLSRRDIIIRCIRVQAVLVLSLLSVIFFFKDSPWAIAVLIALVCVYHITIGIISPLWNSLVGDLIPPSSRGEFFGYRNMWMSIITFLGVVIAGQIIHFSALAGQTAFGYAAVFALAAAGRLLSGNHLAQVPNATLHVPDDSKFTFWQFIRRARHSNFARFTFFVSAMNFATAISGPYFAMYMLKDLGFSYSEYMLVVAAAVLMQFAVMRSWGSLSDQVGARQILRVTGVLVALNPLLWLLSSKLWWVVVVQLYSGLCWAGFNLAAANFVFDAVTPPKRARCFAYQSIVNGTLVFLGSVIGGWLATGLPRQASEPFAVLVDYSPFLIIFVLSGIGRLLVMALLFPTFKEVRSVQKIRSHQILIRVTSLRPLWGATFGLISSRKE